MSELNRFNQSLYDVERKKFITNLSNLLADATFIQIPQSFKPLAEDSVNKITEAIKELIPYLSPALQGILKDVFDDQIEKINTNIKEIYNKLDSFMCEGEPDEPNSKKRRICCYSYSPNIDPSKIPTQPPIPKEPIIPDEPPIPKEPIIPTKPIIPEEPISPIDHGVMKNIYMILYWDVLCFIFDDKAWIYEKPNKSRTKGQFLTQQANFKWKHEPPLVVKDKGDIIFFKYVGNHFIYETGLPRLEIEKPDYIPSFLSDLNINFEQRKRETNFNELLEIIESFDKIYFCYCNQKTWSYEKEKPNPPETKQKYYAIKNIKTIDDAIVYENGLMVRFEFQNFSYWHIPIGQKLSTKHKQYKPDFKVVERNILIFPF